MLTTLHYIVKTMYIFNRRYLSMKSDHPKSYPPPPIVLINKYEIQQNFDSRILNYNLHNLR